MSCIGKRVPWATWEAKSLRGETEAWVPDRLPSRLLYAAVLSQHALRMSSELPKQLSSPTLDKSCQTRMANHWGKSLTQKTEGYNTANRKQEQTRGEKEQTKEKKTQDGLEKTSHINIHHGSQRPQNTRHTRNKNKVLSERSIPGTKINLREENIAEMKKLREEWKTKPKGCVCVCVCLREREAKNKETEKRGEKRKKWNSQSSQHIQGKD